MTSAFTLLPGNLSSNLRAASDNSKRKSASSGTSTSKFPSSNNNEYSKSGASIFERCSDAMSPSPLSIATIAAIRCKDGVGWRKIASPINAANPALERTMRDSALRINSDSTSPPEFKTWCISTNLARSPSNCDQ